MCAPPLDRDARYQHRADHSGRLGLGQPGQSPIRGQPAPTEGFLQSERRGGGELLVGGGRLW